MKSFVALTYLALLVGAPLLSISQASAEKADFDDSFDRFDSPSDRYDPRWGFDRRMIEDAENERHRVCDHFWERDRRDLRKKCRGLSP